MVLLNSRKLQRISTPSPPFDATIPGYTYTVSDALFDTGHGTGSHWHSANEPAHQVAPSFPFGGYAEPGGFFGDEISRGITEFDITGRAAATFASVDFDVPDLTLAPFGNLNPTGGMYGQDPYIGTVQVYGFVADGAETLADYSTAGTLLGTFSTSGLIAGNTLNVDVLSYYNARIAAGHTHLGIRLQITPESPIPDEAFTFFNFRLHIVGGGTGGNGDCWDSIEGDDMYWIDGNRACWIDGS